MRSSCHRAAGFVLLFVVGSAIPAAAEEHPEYGRLLDSAEKLQVLEFLVGQLRGNYELIQTWRGQCDFTVAKHSRGVTPSAADNRKVEKDWGKIQFPPKLNESISQAYVERDGYWFVRTGRADFAVNNRTGSYYVLWDPDDRMDYCDLASGEQWRQSIRQSPICTILTLEKAIEYKVGEKFGPVANFPVCDSLPSSQMVHVRPPKEGKLSFEVIDVRDCFAQFGQESGGPEVWYWSKLKKTVDYVAKGDESSREKIDRLMKVYATSNSPPIYTIVFGQVEKRHEIARYDGQVGFNVIEYSQLSGDLVGYRRKTSYQQLKGVFLPTTVDWMQPYIAERGTHFLVYVCSWIVSTSALNEPVADSDFEIEQFHLSYGDKLLDDIAGRLSVYDDQQGFIDCEKFSFDPARVQQPPQVQTGLSIGQKKPKSSRKGNRFLLIANGVVLLCMVSIFFFWKRRNR